MQVLQIHKVDNGFMTQCIMKEGDEREGIQIANNRAEVLAQVNAKFDEIEGVQAATAAAPEAVVIPFAPVAPPVEIPVVEDPPAPLPTDPVVGDFGSPEHTAELERLITENDRVPLKARLDAHKASGVLADYNSSCKAKSLGVVLYACEKAVAEGRQPTAAEVGSGGTVTNAPVTPQTPVAPPVVAPAPPVAAPVPAPSGGAGTVTIAQVGEALNAAMARLGENGVSQIMGLLGEFGATKASEIPPEMYVNVINRASALVA